MCTGFNINVWPFPSLNVFSDLPKDKSGQWIIRIISESKNYELDPGNLLPMEFFVARSIIGDAVKSKNDVKLHVMLDYIYAHLDEFRFGFDERWEKTKLNIVGKTQIQIVLIISKIENMEKYEIFPIDEYIVAEKSYVR